MDCWGAQWVGCTVLACVGVAELGTRIRREARLIIPEQHPQRLAATFVDGGRAGRVVLGNTGDLGHCGCSMPFPLSTRLGSTREQSPG
jgi:hypothetical protein